MRSSSVTQASSDTDFDVGPTESFVWRQVITGHLQEPDTMTLNQYASLVRRVQQEANVRKTIGAGEVEKIMPYMTRALLCVRNNQSKLNDNERAKLERYIEAAGACLKRCMLEDPAAVEMS